MAILVASITCYFCHVKVGIGQASAFSSSVIVMTAATPASIITTGVAILLIVLVRLCFCVFIHQFVLVVLCVFVLFCNTFFIYLKASDDVLKTSSLETKYLFQRCNYMNVFLP